MRVRRIGAAVLAVALALVPSLVPANLLTNPGFEDGDLTGWGSFGDGWRVSTYGGDIHSGSYGGVDEATVGAGVGYRGIYQEYDVTPGHFYVFSAYGRTWNADESLSFIEIEWRNASNEKISSWASDTISGNIGEDAWVNLTTGSSGVEAPVAAAKAQFKGVVQVTSEVAGDTAYHMFDDFDAHDTIPEPGTAMLLGCALLGIVICRRRTR